MKLVTNSENPFSNPIQMLYSGDFDPKNAYRKPLVMQKTVPKAGCDVHTGKNRPIAKKQKGNRQMTEKKS
jgi:hypothetical protein